MFNYDYQMLPGSKVTVGDVIVVWRGIDKSLWAECIQKSYAHLNTIGLVQDLYAFRVKSLKTKEVEDVATGPYCPPAY